MIIKYSCPVVNVFLRELTMTTICVSRFLLLEEPFWYYLLGSLP